MARKLLFLVLALASCSKGPQADLPYISAARSLAAEWAMVNEQAREGHLTDAYVQTVRAEVRKELQTNSQSLSDPKSAYGAEIGALVKEPDDAAPAELRAHSRKLKQIEDSLESA